MKKPKVTDYELKQVEKQAETKMRVQKDTEVLMQSQQYISVHTQLRHVDGQTISEPVHMENSQITRQRGEPPVFTKPLRPVRVPEGSSVK